MIAIAAAATLAAGCGTTVAPATTHRGGTVVPATPRTSCQPAQLRLSAGPRVSEESEQNTVLLVLRNVSETSCELRGYPRIELLDAAGAKLAFQYLRHGDQMLTNSRPGPVRLRAGATAYSAINKNTCELGQTQLATRIVVTTPGSSRPLTLRLPRYPELGYCGPGQPGHVIDITPVEPTAAAVRAAALRAAALRAAALRAAA
jgi:Protein of unknown function (DUF4232)